MNEVLAMAAMSPLPEPDVIRRTAGEVIRRPEYQLKPTGSGETLVDLLLQILYWLLTPIRWLYELTAGLAEGLRWLIVIGLLVALVVVVTHIIYTFWTALRGPKRANSFVLESERLSHDPAALELQADEALARHDYITAIRLLFRAVLLRLEDREERKFRAGTTNREYLRRYQNTPAFQPMSLFVETIDACWYGRATCSAEDYEVCRQAHSLIRQFTGTTKHAHRA